jgi:hypothetical protein
MAHASPGLQWTFTGPQSDVEYMYALNRHYVFDSLAQAWASTGALVADTKHTLLIVCLLRQSYLP